MWRLRISPASWRFALPHDGSLTPVSLFGQTFVGYQSEAATDLNAESRFQALIGPFLMCLRGIGIARPGRRGCRAFANIRTKRRGPHREWT